jgi:hypothetical protein
MLKLVITAIVALSFVGVANAQEAAKPATPTWTDVQRACGTEYREADKASRPTWQEFLNECKGRKGFVPKKAGKAEFRLPDVAKQ